MRALILLFLLFNLFFQVNLGWGAPLRLISLSPSITRILLLLGARNTLVAVDGPISQAIAGPYHGQMLPMVGDFGETNLEKIIALKPTAVLVLGPLEIPGLSRFQIPIIRFDPKKLTDISFEVNQLGVIANRPSQANALAQRYLAGLQALPQVRRSRPVRVFIEVGGDPLYTLTHASLQGQIVTQCGGENIFGNSPGISIPIHREAVLAQNPQVIFTTVPGAAAYWSQYPQLDAVKNHRVISLNPDEFSEPTPLILKSAQEICRVLKGV